MTRHGPDGGGESQEEVKGWPSAAGQKNKREVRLRRKLGDKAVERAEKRRELRAFST